ncbi:MAG TPA: M48 family metallopeptidase [Candidatus Acidoferrales bacterium]|nr:M48 family metallopeptidase [Candidatus Acidoferrales bacterium]
MQHYIEMFERLFKVATALKLRSAPLCGRELKPLTGAVILDQRVFPKENRDLAFKLLNLTASDAKVTFLVPDSPAASAGLRPGDIITHVDGARVSFSDFVGQSPAEFANNTIARAGDRTVPIKVERGGRTLDLQLRPRMACRYPVNLIYLDSPNAFSDGDSIGITTAMMRALRDDDELAFVLAHEIAHNVLGHVDRRKANAAVGALIGAIFDIGLAAGARIDTRGLGMRTGADAGAIAYSQEFELEADYLGLYLVAQAGFDITKASQVFRRMAMERPETMKRGLLATHPSTPERAVNADNARLEIQQKIQAGVQLLPSTMQGSIISPALSASLSQAPAVAQPSTTPSASQQNAPQLASIERRTEPKSTKTIYASLVQFDGPKTKYGVILDATLTDEGNGNGSARIVYPGNSNVLNGRYRIIQPGQVADLQVLDVPAVKQLGLKDNVPWHIGIFSGGDTVLECAFGNTGAFDQKKGTCKDNFGNRYHLVF